MLHSGHPESGLFVAHGPQTGLLGLTVWWASTERSCPVLYGIGLFESSDRRLIFIPAVLYFVLNMFSDIFVVERTRILQTVQYVPDFLYPESGKCPLCVHKATLCPGNTYGCREGTRLRWLEHPELW